MHNYVTGSGKNNNFAYLFSIIIIAVKVTKLVTKLGHDHACQTT